MVISIMQAYLQVRLSSAIHYDLCDFSSVGGFVQPRVESKVHLKP